MKYVVGFLVLSNFALWYALNRGLSAISEWMDAMTDAYDEHQHVKPSRPGFVELSGEPVSTVAKRAEDATP